MGNRKDHHENEPAIQGQEEASDSKHAPRRQQKGPQAHAEGQHGDKTHSRFTEQLEEGRHEESRDERIERERRENALQGKRRLVEDREQHDEAEKNSEHTKHFGERNLGRDDAEVQPESGYPDGHVPTKPSAPPERDEADELRARAGSEAEFGHRPP